MGTRQIEISVDLILSMLTEGNEAHFEVKRGVPGDSEVVSYAVGKGPSGQRFLRLEVSSPEFEETEKPTPHECLLVDLRGGQ